MTDPYKILGVARDADAAEIKRTYRKLAKKLHPDVNPGDTKIEQRFKQVSQAHAILGDAKKRAQFDRGEIDAKGTPRVALATGPSTLAPNSLSMPSSRSYSAGAAGPGPSAAPAAGGSAAPTSPIPRRSAFSTRPRAPRSASGCPTARSST